MLCFDDFSNDRNPKQDKSEVDRPCAEEAHLLVDGRHRSFERLPRP